MDFFSHLDEKRRRHLETFLEDVSACVEKSTGTKFSKIRAVISDIVRRKGKMLRPILLYLSAHLEREWIFPREKEYELLVYAASSIEILHMATLIHDDMVDEAKYRRNALTIHEQYGKDMAIYTGDFLFSKSLSLLEKVDVEEWKNENGQVASEMNRALSLICESELLQYFSLGTKTSLKKYLRIISGKTASLIAVSAYTGAKLMKCSETRSRQVGKSAYYMGMSFQMIDDLLDFSTTDAIGKSANTDLKKGYFTLPVIMAYENREFESIPSYHDVIALHGIDKAKKICEKYTEKSRKLLSSLPDGEGKRLLLLLERELIHRSR